VVSDKVGIQNEPPPYATHKGEADAQTLRAKQDSLAPEDLNTVTENRESGPKGGSSTKSHTNTSTKANTRGNITVTTTGPGQSNVKIRKGGAARSSYARFVKLFSARYRGKYKGADLFKAAAAKWRSMKK
jgi:hypothetical protein